jgi:hypothetical protein
LREGTVLAVDSPELRGLVVEAMVEAVNHR